MACLQRYAPGNPYLMSRNLVAVVVFLVGLLAVCWIGIGYAGTHPLAAVVAAIIATSIILSLKKETCAKGVAEKRAK